MPPYKQVNPGDQYGCYTVIGKSDKTGNQEFYEVRCNCGYATVIGKLRLMKNPDKCRMCRGKEYTAMMLEKRRKLIGREINGFKIVDVIPSNTCKSRAKFLAECTICGSRRIRTISSMKYKKGERCDACPPDYKFTINGDTAVGHLADGTELMIDTEDISLVEKHHWYINGNGYMFRRDAKTREPFRINRVILGLTSDDDRVVDHLNHNKLDNRKCNMRIVTQSENCMNNIQRCSNTSGYTGVRISENGNTFTAQIEQSGICYELLKTHSIEDAALAYNIAADYLFGVGIGYRNHVMYPSQKFACDIVERIKEIQKMSENKI